MRNLREGGGRHFGRTAALGTAAVLVLGAADGGCSPASRQAAQECAGISDSWERARCEDDVRQNVSRGEGGGSAETLRVNNHSELGRRLMHDMLTTYAQGKPFPWKNYRIQGIEDRTTLGVLRDGDPLLTDVFPQTAAAMIAEEGDQTDKTNAIAHCATFLALDNERYGPINASMDDAIKALLVGVPLLGAAAGATTYIQVRDVLLPYLLREGLREEQEAIAAGVNPLDAENNLYYAGARALCDDTFPFHGMGTTAKGWSGINPLKPTSESEVRQICGESCDGSPSFFEGQGPPLPMIVGLADGIQSVSYESPVALQAPHTGPAVTVFRRPSHRQPSRNLRATARV